MKSINKYEFDDQISTTDLVQIYQNDSCLEKRVSAYSLLFHYKNHIDINFIKEIMESTSISLEWFLRFSPKKNLTYPLDLETSYIGTVRQIIFDLSENNVSDHSYQILKTMNTELLDIETIVYIIYFIKLQREEFNNEHIEINDQKINQLLTIMSCLDIRYDSNNIANQIETLWLEMHMSLNIKTIDLQ